MKKIIISCLLLPAILAGCSKDDISSKGTKDNEQDIRFCIGLEKTRGVIEETFFPFDSKIGIFGIITTTDEAEDIDGYATNYNFQENLNNGLYSAGTEPKDDESTQALIPEIGKGAKFPTNQGAAVVFYAYYPYNEELAALDREEAELPKVPITVSEKMEETPDYIYSEKLISPLTFKPIALKFKHAMGRLDVEIKKTNKPGIEEVEASVTNISVITRKHQKGELFLGNVYDNEKRITFIDQDAEQSSRIDSISYSLEEDFYIEEDYSHTGAKFLLIPDEDAIEKIVLTIRRTGEPYVENKYIAFPANSSNVEIDIKAGKITTLRLDYTPSEIAASAEISLWENDEIHNIEFD